MQHHSGGLCKEYWTTIEIRNRMYKTVLMVGGLVVSSVSGLSQTVAVKTNLLYGVYSSTPNLSIEWELGKRSTLELGGGYNPWNLNGTAHSNKKLVHWLGQAEYRYWLCQSFDRHFFGIHALGSQYNISGHELPLLFGKGSRNYRYEGGGYGGGVSYGYNFLFRKRWSMEATIGVGYVRLHYDKYNCAKCGLKIGTESKNYLGPTKAGISVIYYINRKITREANNSN